MIAWLLRQLGAAIERRIDRHFSTINEQDCLP